MSFGLDFYPRAGGGLSGWDTHGHLAGRVVGVRSRSSLTPHVARGSQSSESHSCLPTPDLHSPSTTGVRGVGGLLLLHTGLAVPLLSKAS